ncbi:MAG: DnaJ family molecular chaperone [Candidatus Kapaibacterium sp.]|jgi:DnaJ-domain-containing protein 1|nr:DnaJ domain-containing protein [Ignavibacteria bacterium]
MGQLWDRVKRFARSQSSITESSTFEELIDTEDDELRKAIDEAAHSTFGSRAAKNNTSKNRIQTEKDRAFAVLGLPITATNDEVRAKYRLLMKEFHPDAVAQQSSAIQDIARKRSQDINIAYQYIKKIRKF